MAKGMATLEAHAKRHPGAVFTVAGVSRDARYVRLTLAIDLGSDVARFSDQSVAAYLFVQDMMDKLFDYLPVYCTEPTVEEREAAASITTLVATAAPVEPAAAPITAEEVPQAATVTWSARQVA